jgi:signal transduction histidine kinase/ActR/RegA family two-component response regulator
MARPRLPTAWLPHSLRTQFLLAISALTLLILAGGITAVHALRTSATAVHQMTEERLVQMQTAQDLMHRTLLIERTSAQLAEAATLDEMRLHYAQVVRLLAESDALTDRLAARVGDGTLLDLHQSSQLFRNTVNVAAQLLGSELHSAGTITTAPAVSPRDYLGELHVRADNLLYAAWSQSDRFTTQYRDAMLQLNEVTQRHANWVTALLATSLLLAWAVAQWFLGRHVLGRLLQISRSLRLGHDTAREDAPPLDAPSQGSDEISEMAHAAALFREDRRQLKQRTEELRLARDAAEAANKAKSVFLANMSHELRTPLNAILGFSQMMGQDPNLSPAQHETIDIINHSGEHLLKLINDVLDIAKIEAGKLQLEVSTFDLHEMVREVADMMQLRAQQKGLQLDVEQSPQIPRYISGDEARLRQILINLVGNAVKFTDQGRVILRLGSRDNEPSHLLLEVEDTGLGISDADQQLLFQPFTQLAEGTMRGGTGLGLSIVRQFVQLMNGRIEVDSSPGKGTLFRVELPLEIADEADTVRLRSMISGEVTGLAPGQPAYRILIAEDQRDNQILLSRLMNRLGLEVKVAENGADCVQIFQGWQPDLIWMDWRMPVMDGVDATRRIRQLPGGDKVRIVAVTASAFTEQEQNLRDAGIDDYVRKPYRFNEIYDRLERHLGLRFAYGTDEAPAAARPILVLSPERVAALGPLLCEELRSAVESLDRTRIDAVIDRIRGVDAELGDTLSRLTMEFDYPSILDALQTEAGASPSDTP